MLSSSSRLLPVLLLAGPLSAQAQETALPFPMEPLTAVDHGVLELAQDPTGLALLTGLERVRLTDVPLPAGYTADLSLERIPFDARHFGVYVDGARAPFDPGDLTLWKGSVVDVEGSEVFLALASVGSYGWIHDGVDTTHLTSFPSEREGWSLAHARLYSQAALDAAGDQRGPLPCLAERLPRVSGGPSIDVGLHNPPVYSGNTLEARWAIETDYQLYQLWGNLNAEQNYVMALLGAISDRYTEQVDIILTFPYVQFHTNVNDGWDAPDQGGSSVDMLYEFQAAWAGNIPNGAHLGHFVSGAPLGGGVAWLDVLCNQTYGFAVSGNINGGVTFPVQQGSNTWDFMVIAHEGGHNTGTPHTHDFCPPLDECAPSGYFGQCQNQQNCTNQGTIMSYCHLCSGGMNNITTYFHPTVVSLMRTEAENSCIPRWDPPRDVLFYDDFESGDFVAGGWVKKNKRPKVVDKAAHEGTYGARVRKIQWIEKAVDTTGYEQIQVSYWRRTSNYDANEVMRLRFWDGNQWHIVEDTANTDWAQAVFLLPVEADDNPAFKIRFKSRGSEAKEKFDLDQVEVSGIQQ
jgi:hypothetical protein